MARRQGAAILEPTDLGPLQSYTDYLDWKWRSTRFPSKADRTRHRLKLGAARVLETVGYQSMRVTDVCREARVALGTFYNYFEDKRAIAVEVMLEFGEELYVQVRRVAGGKSAFDAICSTNRFFISVYRQNAGLVRCLVQLDDQVPEFQQRWREVRARWISRIAAGIARRTPEGSGDDETRLRVAYALECMVFQFLYDVFVRREPYLSRIAGGPEQIAEVLSVLWYRAVYCENPDPSRLEHARPILGLRLRDTAEPALREVPRDADPASESVTTPPVL